MDFQTGQTVEIKSYYGVSKGLFRIKRIYDGKIILQNGMEFTLSGDWKGNNMYVCLSIRPIQNN